MDVTKTRKLAYFQKWFSILAFSFYSVPLTCFITSNMHLTWTTARTSGSEFCVGGTGGRRQKRWWAGASDNIWRSFGEFWEQRKRISQWVSHHDLYQYRLIKAPCSAKLHREPWVSEGRPRTLCGNRTECLCSHNIWKVLVEDNQSWKYISGYLVGCCLVYEGYRSQLCGRGQPETSRGMLRQSKQRRSFSHFSTGSAGA